MLPDFSALIQPAIAAAGAPAAWCAACGTTAPMPCAAAAYAASACVKASSRLGPGGIAAIVLGCALFVLLLAGLVALCIHGYSSSGTRYRESAPPPPPSGAKITVGGAAAAAATGCGDACIKVTHNKAAAERRAIAGEEARELKNT